MFDDKKSEGYSHQESTVTSYRSPKGPFIRSFLTPELEPGPRAKEQIERLSGLYDIQEIALLPDLHSKELHPFPTGMAFFTHSYIHPSVIGKRVGCGMQAIATSLSYSDVSSEMVDSVFNTFIKKVPDVRGSTVRLECHTLDDILYNGAEWALDAFSLPGETLYHIENNGNFLRDTHFSKRDVKKAIPSDVYSGGLKKFGCLGAIGNHFIEMQRVIDIYDAPIADMWGLKKDQIIFMVHADSGALSPRFGKYYVGECGNLNKKQLLRKVYFHAASRRFMHLGAMWHDYFCDTSQRGIDAYSAEGRRYYCAALAIENYCVVNRLSLANDMRRLLSRCVGDVTWRLIYDVSHESIKEECIDGKRMWVHRSGASCALPASAFPGDTVYSKTGQPLLMPGAMGMPSYICTTLPGVRESCYSINHGAGRYLNKAEARGKYSDDSVKAFLEERDIKLFKVGSESMSVQAPYAYKDVDLVIEAVHRFQLARPVLKLQPLAVIKG
ncbi:MAG: RtcB family protein [Candidatus Omnitrophica bacterium]|nr:RtcB family protein [Candidatus Omnitrophota bacterium]